MRSAFDRPGDLLSLAVEACRAAAAEVLGVARRGDLAVGTKSSARDLVTDADRASERALLEALAPRPQDGVVSEEGAGRPSTSGLTWVMDPLDGTTNFVYGRARWAVSLACLDEEGELVGCTYDPSTGETFTAVRRGGAFRDGEPIRVNEVDALDQALVGTGFGTDPELRRHQGAVAGALVPQVRDLRRAGSPCLDLADVACGRLDGFFEVLPGAWDRAVGVLLVREAGGVATIENGPLGAPQVVATGPHLHGSLRRALELAQVGVP